MSPLQQIIPLNPNNINSIKTRFTYRFLRSLKALNNKNNGSSTGSSTSSSREIYTRFHLVKFASNASMAAAVGSKRAWSRAILWKFIKNRNMRRHHHAVIMKIRRRIRRSVSIKGNPKKKGENRRRCGKSAKELQKLVIPGGKGIMEIESLLDETAHYIKCLTTQVQVMQNVLHFYSP